MLKIDLDNVSTRKRVILQNVLYALPRPFFVRFSSSGEGWHIAIPQCPEFSPIREMFDDPMRITLDSDRVRKGIPVRNLLWDLKDGKRAGDWNIIRSERDIENLLDHRTNPNYFIHI